MTAQTIANYAGLIAATAYLIAFILFAVLIIRRMYR